MTRSADIVVVGGSAAGLTAAITARRHYPEKTTLLVRKEEQVSIPCGIPYIFGTLGSPEKNLIPDAILEKNGIELSIAEATAINRDDKILNTSDGDIEYDRLVLATGSEPSALPIEGIDLDGVFAIRKEIAYLRSLQERIAAATDVVVIGGGFIGIEFADEIKKADDKKVTVVEVAAHCLSLAYDAEFCVRIGFASSDMNANGWKRCGRN